MSARLFDPTRFRPVPAVQQEIGRLAVAIEGRNHLMRVPRPLGDQFDRQWR